MGSSRIASKSESSFADIAKLLCHVDRAPQVIERVSRSATEALAASEVVEQQGVLRRGFDQDAQTVGDLGVLARLVERDERSPEFPAAGLVRLSRRAFERDDGRPCLLGGRRSLDAGMGENERSCGRVHPVSVELKHRVASQHEEKLLVCCGIALVVQVDD